MTDAPRATTDDAGSSERPLQPEDLPGIYLIAGGVLVAVLAPLFGFLGGSMVGTENRAEAVQPLALWLTGGLVVGGIGAVVAFLGGVRLVRHRRHERERQNQAPSGG